MDVDPLLMLVRSCFLLVSRSDNSFRRNVDDGCLTSRISSLEAFVVVMISVDMVVARNGSTLGISVPPGRP